MQTSCHIKGTLENIQSILHKRTLILEQLNDIQSLHSHLVSQLEIKEPKFYD